MTATSTAQAVPQPWHDIDDLSDRERACLALLRVAGARCRVMARSDLFRACAMLSADRNRAAEAVATALIRGLTGAGGLGGLRLFQSGATDLSFDERWLLAAVSAADRFDTDSMTFLLARRLPMHTRRQIGFLIMSLSQAMATPASAPALAKTAGA
jgi:hypothetical protein